MTSLLYESIWTREEHVEVSKEWVQSDPTCGPEAESRLDHQTVSLVSLQVT